MNKIVLFSLLLLPTSAKAIDLSGHLKYQASLAKFESDDLNARLNGEEQFNNEVDFRVNSRAKYNRFGFKSDLELLSSFGEQTKTRAKLEQLPNSFPFSRNNSLNDRNRLFDLSLEIGSEDSLQTFLRLDRAYVAYNTERLVAKLGRQAISWGNGLAFHVLDPFNPFSPTEIDKDYKSGDDMLYLQWLFQNGDDLQLLAVARRDTETNSILSKESSYAAKYHGSIYLVEADYDLLVAEHFDESMIGAGLSLTLLDAVWRTDFSYTKQKDAENAFSFVFNVDYSLALLEKNVYLFIEYYKNGFGQSDYQELRPALLDRVNRGEVFTLAKNYLASGARVEWSNLLNFFPLVIFNLSDESGTLQLRAEYDYAEDISFNFGVNLPFGTKGSEFGGIRVNSAGEEFSVGPASSIYFRVSKFW